MGIGLGVWQVIPLQAKWMVEVVQDILKNHKFPNISDVDFSWFPPDVKEATDLQDGKKFNGVKIHFSSRNPAAKLEGANEKLIVASYAWDGNAFPGNEYFSGMLTASGDPAAASCSIISEIQNPLINPYLNLEKYPSNLFSDSYEENK